jgi:hypothetical protein
MRRPTARPLLALVLLLVGSLAACNDDDGSDTTSSPTTTASTTTTAGVDPSLAGHLLTSDDLPDGFTESPDVDDTVTSFCATEDAAAGLQASAREVRGFTRSAGGASVIQVVVRFRDDDASAFVAQASAILDRCSGVPDGTGLAFEYDSLPPDLEAVVAAASDALVGRHGVSVGSGNLTVDLIVFHRGDVGQLVAVLGLDLPRADLDALAAAAFGAVAAKS